MARLPSPCLGCGAMSVDVRCAPCMKKSRKVQPVVFKTYRGKGSQARGYDRSWRVLSEKARKLQPFCSDCGALDDLQGDHSPEAWQRKERGLAIRLQDIDVVCGEDE